MFLRVSGQALPISSHGDFVTILSDDSQLGQIQSFAESVRTTEFHLADQEGGLESAIELSRAEDQDGEAAVKNAQELITRLSVNVICELRKGVDIGDLTVARGQAGFRLGCTKRSLG